MQATDRIDGFGRLDPDWDINSKGASNAAMHVDLQWGDTQGAP